MKYLLDTNICIYIIKNRPESVFKKFSTISNKQIHISTITIYELFYGAYKSAQVEKNCKALDKFISPLQIVDFDNKSAQICGQIKSTLSKEGNIIGPYDLQIAAIALANNLSLVSNNLKEFTRISEFKCENWC